MENEVRKRGGVRWWMWAPLIVTLPLALLLWWVLRQSAARKAARAIRIELKLRPKARSAGPAAGVAKPAPTRTDNLQRIEGIGPKIAGTLRAAGIKTFAQLAAADADSLRETLREAGITVADPTTWPEQAQLAAAGQWGALEALQAGLKGGRRV